MSAESRQPQTAKRFRSGSRNEAASPRVKGTEVLRIDYPGYTGEDTLEQISWEEFFETFEASDLAFLYRKRQKTVNLAASQTCLRDKEKEAPLVRADWQDFRLNSAIREGEATALTFPSRAI